MTQLQDPGRWTAMGSDAPDGLRDLFAAGRSEGPSAGQMRALSLKLAAVAATGAGAAAAVSAAKPAAVSAAKSASTTFASVKSAIAGSKLIGLLTVASAVTVGGAVAYRSATTSQGPTFRSGPEAAALVENAPVATAPVELGAPGAAPAVAPSIREAAPSAVPAVSPVAPPASPATETARAPSATVRSPMAVPAPVQSASAAKRGGRDALRAAAPVKPAAQPATHAPSQPASAPSVSAEAVTELSLLRQAQVALVARPREAYALTQQHRAKYPRGQFAEERDAIAIQALLRIGERDVALDLAERFVAAHPSSAHAHTFRELLQKR
jgi:hypothetical protein